MLTLLSLSLVQTPASAEAASVTGVVTAAGTNEPIDACVSIVDADFNPVGNACTDPETGEWAVPDLTVGMAYRVSAEAFGYASQWFDGVYDFYAATEVSAPAFVAIEMERVGQVSGTLTQPDGSPAPGFWVTADSALGSFSAMTDDAGQWFMEVPPGDYRIRFTDWMVTQYAYGKRSAEDADLVSVAGGGTAQVDDQLLPVAEVVGTVTDTLGNPLSGICASVIDPGSFSEYDSVGSACTDENGRYRIVPYAEGTFSVWFQDTNEPRVYAPEFAGDTYAAASAAPLEIRVGQPVTVDAAMAVGGVLTGKTVSERRPRGISDVCARPYAGREGGPIAGSGGSCTGADGTYRITALPPGPVTVRFDPSYRSGVVGEWYLDQASQAAATVVDVALGSTTSLRPNKFTPGGTVTGVVTGPDGAPIEGAWVNLDGFYPGRAGPGEGQYTVETDAQGRYTMPAAPGTYAPFVYAVWQDLAPEWSGNATTRAAAAPLEVKAFRTTTFNVQLAPAAHITGDVVDAVGAPIQMEGQIFTTTGDYIGDWFASPDNGTPITSTALPAGTFVLNGWIHENGWEEPPTTVWFDAASSRDDATTVSLTVGETKEITFRLP